MNAVQLLAQSISAGDLGIPTGTGDDTLQIVLNIFYFIAGVVAVIVIVLAGIRYAGSQGNASSVSAAKNQILYAVIGLVVIIAAFAITNFVVGRL